MERKALDLASLLLYGTIGNSSTAIESPCPFQEPGRKTWAVASDSALWATVTEL
jgi:hypothetical protein